MAAPPADDDEENLIFNVEDVQKIVRDNIEMCLGGNGYSHSRCPIWINIITDKTLGRLSKLNKPFKYINPGSIFISNLLCHSENYNNPEEWFSATHCCSIFLGHCHGRHMHCALGEQVYVLHSKYLGSGTSDLNKLF